MRLITFVFVALLVASCVRQDQEGPDQIDQESSVLKPMASWVDGAGRDALIQYVEEVTDQASDNFIPVAERIAVFDNDGTLWSEQPLYFQLFFAFDRMKYLACRAP